MPLYKWSEIEETLIFWLVSFKHWRSNLIDDIQFFSCKDRF